MLREREGWTDALRRGSVDVHGPATAIMILALPAIYGLGVGLFGPAHGVASWRTQLLSTVAKLPTLTFLSFLATLPAFFAARWLGGLRLTPGGTLRLCLATFGVFAAGLGLLAPVTAAVSVLCNYSFTTLLNLVFLAASGLWSVGFLLRSVRRLAEGLAGREDASARPARRTRRPVAAFMAWAMVFGLVGAQLGWRMRPLVGWRDVPFGWFRLGDDMTLWEGIASELYNIFHSGGA